MGCPLYLNIRGVTAVWFRGTLSAMTTEVRTPFLSAPVELSGGGLFRKQVLQFGTIHYQGRDGKRRKITFDRDYGRKLVKSFKSGAYRQVPFQLADADNRHTNDPTRTGGEVVGVELSADGSGVDAYLRTWGAGTKVVEENPGLGVSARLFENITRPDGRTHEVAMQHVLGTVDPQMEGMRPWERVSSVDLANGEDAADQIDLSNAVYERSNKVPGKQSDKDGDTVVLELSVANKERLERLLEDDEAMEAIVAELGEDFLAQFETNDEPEGNEDDEEPGEEDTVQLSNRHSEALELANAGIESLNSRVIELSSQLTQQRVDTEVDGYVRQNLAPAVLEAARPLLEVESGAIELSNGTSRDGVDVGAVIREVLNTVIELSNSGHLFVDPTEVGSLEGNDVAKSNRDAMLADWDNYS